MTAFLGILLTMLGHETVGITLALAGTGMMLAAALVLILSDGSKARAAILQGTFPLLAVLALALSLI